MLNLDSEFDLDRARNEIEQTRIRLDSLVNLEDSSSSVMENFKDLVEQINQILAELHSSQEVSPDGLLQKSSSLEHIGSLLIDAANKYQESFSQNFLQQVKYCGQWFLGTGKEYAIHAFTKQVSKPSKQHIIQFIKLITNFAENYWSTHPEKVLQLEEFALQVSEADESNMSDEFQKVSQKYVQSVFAAADKVRLKKLQDSSKNVKQMVDWVINTPKWQGDDFDECLEIVENSRVQAEF